MKETVITKSEALTKRNTLVENAMPQEKKHFFAWIMDEGWDPS